MSSPEHIGETLKKRRESNSASPSLYKLLSLNFNGVSPSTLKIAHCNAEDAASDCNAVGTRASAI